MTILNIQAIRLDGGTQSRDKNDQDHIDHIAEQIKNGETLPPITVVFDGLDYYLADGFHRVLANIKLGKASINCEVINGSLRDAIDLSGMANTTHGLNRSAATKRKQVLIYLEDFEWAEMSDREIAKKVRVSHTFVSNLRDELTGKKPPKSEAPKGKPADKQKVEPKENSKDEPEVDLSKNEMVQSLVQENQKLTDRLAVAVLDATPEEKDLAQQTITELREELRVAKIELDAVKRSRDTFQSENVQLKKQVAMLQKQLKK
jgi:hypothetical protein